jgi:hypothetical protein
MRSGNGNDASGMPLVIAGLESGVLGGMFMLAWLGFLSILQGRSVWTIPNLLASTFYGEAALRRGFRWSTLSGVALHVIMSATVGLLFSVAARGILSRRRVMLFGVAAGGSWYFVSLGIFWRYVNPMVPLYSSGSGLFLAHIGLGMFLGSFPRFLEGLETPSAVAVRQRET